MSKNASGLVYTFTLTTPLAAGIHTVEPTTYAGAHNNLRCKY